MMKIRSVRLTTCSVLNGGHVLRLDFVDETGADVSLELPFDQTQAIAMTLPALLTRALQAITGKESSRYVFPLDRWAAEKSDDSNTLLLTLTTDDGFQVSFGVAAEACRGLGLTLVRGCDPEKLQGVDDETEAQPSIALN